MVKLYTPRILLIIVSVLLSSAIFIGCKKNNIDVPFINEIPPDLTTQVRSSVSGFVTNENDAAVNLATVQVGTATVTTDKYGYFEVQNVDVVKNAAVVTVTKAGYFKGIKTYIAEGSNAAFFRIKLIPKTNAGTVNGTTGGAVTLLNGLSITLPANAVMNATTNAAYTGTVNVSAYWIDPTAADLFSKMPGDLRGLNTDGNLQLLTTYGMTAIELTGSGGELLQIVTGKKAMLSLPIPSSISSSAPASIPLWYFDEVKGLWKQEGAAIKTGNNYVGEVSHFSFWNCDLPEYFVELSATIVNNSNQPIPYAVVKISVIGNPANFRYGYTNSAGYVNGAVPRNTPLLFEVYSNLACLTPLYAQNVTTTNAANLSLGTIIVTSGTNLATITGNVVNCFNAPVTNGYVMVFKGNSYTRLNLSNTGNYSGTILVCSNTGSSATLVADDLATNMTSGPVIRNIVPGTNNIPQIQVCTTLQEYVNFTKNGIPESYQYLFLSQATSNPLSYGIFFYADPGHTIYRGYLQISQAGIAAGSTQNLLGIATAGTAGSNMTIPNPVNVSITEYGGVGQYMAGNFSGNFLQPPSNTPYAITCSFRIKRTF
ncbi:MAG: carboxypeptidase-like regulatory domain-containing protein [Ferruginibacter sp.]